MRKQATLATLMGIAALASGCMSEEHRRADGLTGGAGDAVAANTVMQMVDPWADGVENTRLRVPAARATAGSAGVAGDGTQSQTMGSSGN